MQTLEKRSLEQVLFDIDCSALLAQGETITTAVVVAHEPATSPDLTFGTPVVNGSATTYTDRFGSTHTAPIGTVVQVMIGGGFIPAAAQTQNYVIRVLMQTNLNPAVEAAVRLQLNDTPL